LEELLDVWPVPIDEVALIGHSMGGLVKRGACHQADVDDARRIDSLGDIVGLATPHLA